MRVLHLGKYYPPFAGGMEYFLGDLLPALQSQGVDSAALVHAHTGPGERPATATPPLVWRAPCHGRLLYAPVSPAFPRWLARIIGEFRPDLLHLHLPNTSAFWAMAIPAARRLPWVIHWHSDVVASRLDRRLALAYGLYRPLEQRLLARSRAIIATSPAYLDFSAALRPWRHKARTIPLGLDPARIADPPPDAIAWAESHWGVAGFRVLAIGRLTYYKGHDRLIQAMAELPGDTRLLIVGSGEHRQRLAGLIRERGLEGRVELLGFQPEAPLNALLASCQVLALPSLERTEAFGLVLLEAMRFARPVLASDIPGSGVGWVVRQGGHGLLVPPADPAALARALGELRSNPRRREALGRQGTQALGDSFAIEQVAAEIGTLYGEVLA